MGSGVSTERIVKIFSKKVEPTKKIYAIFGLDGSGKTAFAYALKNYEQKLKIIIKPTLTAAKSKPEDEALPIFIPPPTNEMTSFTYEYKNYFVQLDDFPGGAAYRDQWDKKLDIYDAVIYVIDSIDHVRFALACDRLRALYEMCEVPGMKVNELLILFTKVDFDGHLPEDEWNTAISECCHGKTPFTILKCDYQYQFLGRILRWMINDPSEMVHTGSAIQLVNTAEGETNKEGVVANPNTNNQNNPPNNIPAINK